MKNIIFIAPPAAGKGTMSSLISKNYNIPHISTGNLLREKTKENTEQGRFIKDEIQKGNLITDEIMNKYDIDSASSGGAINEFNNIDELLVWLSATEDTRNGCIRVSIRSRGPEINKIAEKYNGGGHKLASGARLVSFEEVLTG